MGVDEISLHLLQDQKQHHEHQGLPGVRHGDEQRAHAAADEGAHNGDEGRQGNEDPHQQGIGQAEQRHGHHEHGTQDDRLRALTGEKAGKGPVGQRQHLQRPVRPPLRQKAV